MVAGTRCGGGPDGCHSDFFSVTTWTASASLGASLIAFTSSVTWAAFGFSSATRSTAAANGADCLTSAIFRWLAFSTLTAWSVVIVSSARLRNSDSLRQFEMAVRE